MNVELIALFPQGGIREMVEEGCSLTRPLRSTPKRKEPPHPLALPQVKGQCALVEQVYDDVNDRYYIVRCTDDAVSNGRHGFLCGAHSAYVDRGLTYKKLSLRDDEAVSHLLAQETKAIEKVEIKTVGVGRVTMKVADYPLDHPTRREKHIYIPDDSVPEIIQ